MKTNDLAFLMNVQKTHIANSYASNYTANPTAGTVLVDTAALINVVYDVDVYLSSDANIGDNLLQLQWRNAANSGDLWAIRLMVLANTTLYLPIHNFKPTADERLRIQVIANITANVSTALRWVQRERSGT